MRPSNQFLRCFLLAATSVSLFSRPALGGYVQYPNLDDVMPATAPQYRDMCKQAFTDSYEVYRQYAFGHDTVLPISQGWTDDRNGWGVTIIDGLSTMHIMGLNDLFTEGVQWAATVDFTRSGTASSVSVFETTIRHMGGLLSAYELSGQQYPTLLDQAKQLADKLIFAWDGANDVPYGAVDFGSDSPVRGTSNIAEAGTLTLEWAMLSKYTGNETYREYAEKSALHLINGGSPLSGLPAQGIDPGSGASVGSLVTWGGGSDSYFEYLIKYPRFNLTANVAYADSWRTAVDSSIQTLLRYSTYGNWTYLADYDPSGPQAIKHVGSHLACFHGGNWLLGGRLLNNDTVVDHGLRLIDACWNTYESAKYALSCPSLASILTSPLSTGIGPETWSFTSSDGSYTGQAAPSPDQATFNSQHGFYITDGRYQMRPEMLESNFYAWRVTGDAKYYERAVAVFESLANYLTVNGNSTMGYSGLVNDMDASVAGTSKGRIDRTESFWFAEVLKYLYLTFDDPSHIHLDEYVFNTEAHPFRVPAASPSTTYGSGRFYDSAKPFVASKGALPQFSQLPKAISSISGLV
ncbi:alpha-mannosidase 1 [Coprinopsis sp. MPI-PUGE-AT-0042]|nr:alpha-mannosidase 1 [Coprinopsis sp. MPI-PUGE-AT-0042]